MKKRIVLLMLTAMIWAAPGQISGVVFFDYTYDLTENAENDIGFRIKRAYFTYMQELSDGINFRLQTDVGRLKTIDAVEPDEMGSIDVSKKGTQYVTYVKKG